MRESHKEAAEEPAKVGWTCGMNGRGTVDEDKRCAWSGVYKEKRKTGTEMGGLRKERFSGIGGEWRMRARDTGEWRRLVEMIVKRD